MPSATSPSMLVRVEFHSDCASRSVSRLQILAAGAPIEVVTELANRNAERVVVAAIRGILPSVR